MKRQAFVILTTLSLLVMLTATSIHAQSDMRIKVTIPFEFSVRDKLLPAGEYTVKYMSQGTLAIQSVDRHVSQIFSTLSTHANSKRDESSLVFTRYGDRYFLSTIWTAGDDIGLALRKPAAEMELLRVWRSSAANASERQTVSIVAHR
jgi:hypothetical protein